MRTNMVGAPLGHPPPPRGERAGNPRQDSRNRPGRPGGRPWRGGEDHERRYPYLDQLVTNAQGYFEAPLLQPGTYDVTVEMAGFKTATRSGVQLAVAQQVTPVVHARSRTDHRIGRRHGGRPVIDTTSVSSGANFDTQMVNALPMFSNMPISLARFAPGVNPDDDQPPMSQGFVTGPERSGRHGDRRRRQQHVHDRRRDQRGRQPPALHVTQLRHDSGDARRDVELRRRHGPRARQPDLDDDEGRHEYDARHRQLSVLDEQAQRAQRAAEDDVQRRGASGVRGRPFAQLGRHARRTGRHSARHRRPQQDVLLRATIPTSTTRFREGTSARARSRPIRNTCRATSRTCCSCPIRPSTSSTTR